MELRLPLEMSPGREAACRAVFGTWGFFRKMHGKTAPSCSLHSQGGGRRGLIKGSLEDIEKLAAEFVAKIAKIRDCE